MIVALDKKLHIGAGIGGAIFLSFFLPPVYAFIGMSIIGVLKEALWDGLMKKGVPDKWDAVVTIGGAAGGVVMFELAKWLLAQVS